MLYTMIQPKSFLDSGERDFLVFFNGAEPFEQIDKYPINRIFHLKSGENCSSGYREEDI